MTPAARARPARLSAVQEVQCSRTRIRKSGAWAAEPHPGLADRYPASADLYAHDTPLGWAEHYVEEAKAALASAASALSHSHICTIFDVGTSPADSPYEP